MEWLTEVLKLVGLDPALTGTAISVGIVLRFARAGLSWFGTLGSLLCAIASGAAVAAASSYGTDGFQFVPGAGSSGAAFTAVVLVIQSALKAASSIPGMPDWLKKVFPEDNAFVKPTT